MQNIIIFNSLTSAPGHWVSISHKLFIGIFVYEFEIQVEEVPKN
jgi:hypothetical protein